MAGLHGGRAAARWVAPVATLGLAIGIAACELTETIVAPGQSVVVVQAVISRGAREQLVLVEYSETGEALGDTGWPIPPEAPRFPITGALVTIEHLAEDAPDAPCVGHVDTLPERPPIPEDTGTPSGVYAGTLCDIEPGERLALTVRTPRGETVTGTTLVAGAAARELIIAGRNTTPGDTATFNTGADTLRIGLTPMSGRGMQVEAREANNHGRIAVYAFLDTLGIALAGNLVNPFEGDSGESVFRAGRYYALTVSLLDSNYFDFIRSRSDPITGRGFLNHLRGGIGVFGSLEAAPYVLRATGRVDDPREGVYRLSGSAEGDSLDVTLEVYVDDLAKYAFSAFVEGTWFGAPLKSSGDGLFGISGTGQDPNDETFGLSFVGPQADSLARAYVLTGRRSADGTSPFPVQLTYHSSATNTVVDTLIARQVSGPASSARTR